MITLVTKISNHIFLSGKWCLKINKKFSYLNKNALSIIKTIFNTNILRIGEVFLFKTEIKDNKNRLLNYLNLNKPGLKLYHFI